MQSTLKNVQEDQNRQQKQQDQLWKEYQEWERDANEAEMQIPDNMEADPAVPSAFGEKDQQFVFGQSGPSSQSMCAGNGLQFQSDQCCDRRDPAVLYVVLCTLCLYLFVY